MMIWHLFVNSIAAAHWTPRLIRVAIYRVAGLDVPIRAGISPTVIFRGPHVSLGGGTTVNYRCIFDSRAWIRVGDNVGIGMNVTLLTGTHQYTNPQVRAGDGVLAPIVIGDGAWIGSGVTVMPGVTIGPGCVIAAGAVVNRDCEPHGLYGGIPARRLRDLPAD